MKIKLNLSEAHFLKWVMETFLTPENKRDDKLIAKDILNKLEK